MPHGSTLTRLHIPGIFHSDGLLGICQENVFPCTTATYPDQLFSLMVCLDAVIQFTSSQSRFSTLFFFFSVCSTKFVGIFSILFVGLLMSVEVWRMLPDHNLTMVGDPKLAEQTSNSPIIFVFDLQLLMEAWFDQKS